MKHPKKAEEHNDWNVANVAIKNTQIHNTQNEKEIIKLYLRNLDIGIILFSINYFSDHMHASNIIILHQYFYLHTIKIS